MSTQQQALTYLRSSVGNPGATFRPGQWEAIDRIVNQKGKLLVVERTGWGKSSVYFISTRLLRAQGSGPTIIISPLLALMRNQIEAAERFGLQAETINSTNQDEWDQAKENILSGETDVLFISPERLANDDFMTTVLQPVADAIGLFVVDEAHCISDWGHDFRVDYRRIVNILNQLPGNLPVLATTATANDRVINDVTTQLGNIQIQRGSLDRTSLQLQNIWLPDQPSRLAWLAEHLPKIPGTGIIYTLTKRDANLVARWLQDNGIEAFPYYSNVSHEDYEDSNDYRLHLEDQLLNNRIKALVATTSLGMGYDKPDLAFVIHYQAPGSIVGYYQQVGRAGRGIPNAYGIMLSGKEDDTIHEFFRRSAFPTQARIDAILNKLAENDGGLSVPQLNGRLNFRKGQIEHALKFMSVERPSPVIKVGSKWRRTPVAYQLDQEKARFLTRQRYEEWNKVIEYLRYEGCLMSYLQEQLDDPTSGPCGRCANCQGSLHFPDRVDQVIGQEAASFLRHIDFPLTLRKQFPPGAVVNGLSKKIPENLRGEEGRIMSRWRDAGWGTMVAEGKQNGYFNDQLVEAISTLILHAWEPEPRPTWVTCVPSLNHPELVPDFARRVAVRLNLPFHPVIRKVKSTPPQKNQENSYFQCKNLDGAFAVEGDVPSGPVLLVDDAVDSGWTLTLLAALLLQSGSGPVFPVALTSTSFSE